MFSGGGDKPISAPLQAWTPELQSAYRILQDFLGSSLRHIAYVFINPVDSSEPGAEEYYDRIKEPMCLLKMKEKFGQSIYSQIGDFVCDFRLMLFNCYVYNGVDSPLGKQAAKMETLFEQKIGLLSRDLRERCSLGATLGAASLSTVLDSRSYLHDGPVSAAAGTSSASASSVSAALVDDPAAEWRAARRAAAAMRVVSGSGLGGNGGASGGLGGIGGGFAASRESLPVQAMVREAEDAAATREEAEARVAAIVERLRRWEVRRHEERLLAEFDPWRNMLATEDSEFCLRHCAELAEVAHFLVMMGPEMLGLHASGLAEALTAREIHLSLLSPQSSSLLTGIMCGLFAKLKCGLARATKDAAAAAAAAANPALGLGSSSFYYNRAPLPAIVYHHWHDRLKQRVAAFYRHLTSLGGVSNAISDAKQASNQQSAALTATSFLCPEFADVVGHRNPLEIRMFHELTLFQRVHILKALIDSLLSRGDQFLRELDERCQLEDFREIRLGSVGRWVYIRLEGLDVEARHWVYRRAEYPVIEYSVQPPSPVAKTTNRKSKKPAASPEKSTTPPTASSNSRKRKADSSPNLKPSSSARGRRRIGPSATTTTTTPNEVASGRRRGRRSRLEAPPDEDEGATDVVETAISANVDDVKSLPTSTTPPPPELKVESEPVDSADDDEDKTSAEQKQNNENSNATAPELSLANDDNVEAMIPADPTAASASTSASTAPATADEEAANNNNAENDNDEVDNDKADEEADEQDDQKLIEEMYKVNIERPDASKFELVAQTLSELRSLISGFRAELDQLKKSKDEFDVKISKRGRKSKSVLAVDSDALDNQIASQTELLDALIALESDWEAAAPRISHRDRRMKVRVMHEFEEFEKNQDYYLRGELAEELADEASPAASGNNRDDEDDDDGTNGGNSDSDDDGSEAADDDGDYEGGERVNGGSKCAAVQDHNPIDENNVGISTRRKKYRIQRTPPPPPPPRQPSPTQPQLQQLQQRQFRTIGPRPPPQLPQLPLLMHQLSPQPKASTNSSSSTTTIVRLMGGSANQGGNVQVQYGSAARQATASTLLQQHLNAQNNSNNNNNSSSSSVSTPAATSTNAALPVLSIRLTTPPVAIATVAAASACSSSTVNSSTPAIVGQIVGLIKPPPSAAATTVAPQQQQQNQPPASLSRSNLTQTVDCVRGAIPTSRLQQAPQVTSSATIRTPISQQQQQQLFVLSSPGGQLVAVQQSLAPQVMHSSSTVTAANQSQSVGLVKPANVVLVAAPAASIAAPQTQTVLRLTQQQQQQQQQPQPTLIVNSPASSQATSILLQQQQQARRNVTLYKVGGVLFTPDCRPVVVENQTMRYLPMENIDQALLTSAKQVITEALKNQPSQQQQQQQLATVVGYR